MYLFILCLRYLYTNPLLYLFFFFFFEWYGDHRNLHSFPTRRSSDLKKKLAETYGVDSVVSIYGKDSVDVRNQAVEKFQNKEECRFLVGNPTVGGYGLTLTAAKYVIYFSNSYNLEVRQQSEDRAHRIGQKSQVTYIDIICRDTIDQMVLHNLENKIELSAKTLGEQVQKWL